jgi:hypothetical protein
MVKVEEPEVEQYLAITENGQVYQVGREEFAMEQGQEYQVIAPKMETDENENIQIFEVTDEYMMEDIENIDGTGGGGSKLLKCIQTMILAWLRFSVHSNLKFGGFICKIIQQKHLLYFIHYKNSFLI